MTRRDALLLLFTSQKAADGKETGTGIEAFAIACTLSFARIAEANAMALSQPVVA